MSYRFKCDNCGHEFEWGYSGNYSPTFVTNNPCIKCDKKTVKSYKIEVAPVESTNKAPTFIYKNHLRPSRDFVNHLENIKKAHPNSTIEIKY